ncbi:MAG: acyl-CoA dehydratase activase [Planctomycetota bacterium]|jgi:predicted CoA-substrate-specific enzyme activase|nr:acyl-CoA dehydratase activase [Planctomycetota bacterium]
MNYTAGIDVGSTYTKALLLDDNDQIVAKVMRQTGFKLGAIAQQCYDELLHAAKVEANQISYVVATGYGRHQVKFKDVHVTDLTAGARGAKLMFPNTRTVLDIGGQTMKAIRVEEDGTVKAFRLNDKCAAGTGAFLEKTGRYMGFKTTEIADLLKAATRPAEISGVCAVFAESEVINQLSIGTPPADIMQGAINSLTTRAIQLMKRVKGQSEYTLIGGIMRFPSMPRSVEEQQEMKVNLADGEMTQFVSALGAAWLGRRRYLKINSPQALESDGWERRFMGSDEKLEEHRANYESMGYAVKIVSPSAEEFSSDCGDCAETACAEMKVIYTKK